MPINIWKGWVPISMDPDRHHLEDYLIKCWENQQDQIQELLRTNTFFGEFNPNFEVGDGSQIKNLYRYLTVATADAAFKILNFDYSDKSNLKIEIKTLSNWVDRMITSYHDGNERPLIFVPRMLRRNRFVTFDAYPAGTYPSWSHM